MSRKIIDDYLASASGRSALAKALVQPIKSGLNYQSIGHKAFSVEPLCEVCREPTSIGAEKSCSNRIARSVMES